MRPEKFLVLIQMLKARTLNVMPDPGNLLQCEEIGRSHCFQLMGTNQGPVWGTDIYTSDSHLATAAVHAGALVDHLQDIKTLKRVLIEGTNATEEGIRQLQKALPGSAIGPGKK